MSQPPNIKIKVGIEFDNVIYEQESLHITALRLWQMAANIVTGSGQLVAFTGEFDDHKFEILVDPSNSDLCVIENDIRGSSVWIGSL